MKQSDERHLSVDDWKAFYLVFQLLRQVALYGKPALDTFMEAARVPSPSDSRTNNNG